MKTEKISVGLLKRRQDVVLKILHSVFFFTSSLLVIKKYQKQCYNEKSLSHANYRVKIHKRKIKHYDIKRIGNW